MVFMSKPKLKTPPGFPTSGTRNRLVENCDASDATFVGSTASKERTNCCMSLVSLVGNICRIIVAAASPAEKHLKSRSNVYMYFKKNLKSLSLYNVHTILPCQFIYKQYDTVSNISGIKYD